MKSKIHKSYIKQQQSICKKLLILLAVIFGMNANAQFCFKSPSDYSYSYQYYSYGSIVGQTNSLILDVNNDGKKDVVTSGQGAFLLYFNGNGTGKFPPSSQVGPSISTFIHDMKEADFNNDGFIDIAMNGHDTQNNNVFQVAFGNGTGNFFGGTMYTLPVNSSPSGPINTGDFTSDGYIDIIMTIGTRLILFVNDSTGGFTMINTHNFGVNVFSILDINNDGNLDLNSGTRYYLGNGNATFDTINYVNLNPINYTLTTWGAAPCVSDMNNDGKTDFVYLGNDKIDIILAGTTYTNTSQFIHTAASYTPIAIQIGDFNGDHLKDIVCLYDLAIEILINQGNNTFVSAGISSTNSSLGSYVPANGSNSFTVRSIFSTGDLNNDGIDDIAIPGEQLNVILGNASKNYPPDIRVGQYVSSTHINTGDFNNDGKIDFYGGSINLNIGNGTFNTYTISPVGSAIVFTADFDNDGKLDLVSAGSTINFNKGLGNGAFSNTTYTYSIDPISSSVAVIDLTIGDFNNDGKPDVATQNNYGRNSVFINTGNMTFSASVIVSGSGYVTGNDIASADFNKDGNLDFITLDWSHPIAHLFLGNGNGTFNGQISITMPGGCSHICVADFNGDGKKDFACTNGTNTYSLLGNGDTTFQAGITMIYNGGGQNVFAQDLNNDGRDEIIIPTSSEVIKIAPYGTSGLFPVYSIITGNPNGALAFADIDADGRKDILVGDNGDVLILYNNSAIIPSSVSGTLLCSGGSIAVNMPNGTPVSWNTGSTSNPCIITAPGTYVVTSTNFSGSCSSSDTLVVITSTLTAPAVNIAASSNASCVNTSTINLIGSPLGGSYYGQGVAGNIFKVQQANIGINTAYYSFIDTSGCSNVDSAKIFVDHCVWPGDANEDLIVDNTDLLPIGIEYGRTGAARNTISNNWQGYTCNNWNDTLSNGKNIKYTDCNGDSTINFNDTLAVGLNYNLTHTARLASPQIIQTMNPDIYLQFNNPQYIPGDTVKADVMIGSNTNSQTNFYGSAFTLSYDNTKVQSGTEKFYFNNSWVGTINQSKIKFSKLNTSSGIVDGSLVRITHTDTTGYGKVATLQFVLKNPLPTSELYFTISSAIKTNSVGTISNLNTGTDSVKVNTTTGISQISGLNSQISVYPNPNNGSFLIEPNTTEKQTLQLFDINGNLVLTQTIQGKTIIDARSLAAGFYNLSIIGNDGVVNKKLVIVK